MKVAILYSKVEGSSDLIAEQDVLKVVDDVESLLKELNHKVSRIELNNVFSSVREPVY